MIGSKTIEIIALGKDQASKVLGGVGSAVSGLGSIAAGVATGGLALVGAAIVGIGAAAVIAAKEVVSFSLDSTKAMNKFQAQTGASAAEMLGFTESAKSIYAAGVGESIADVAEQMALVHKATGLTGFELEMATSKAVRLGEVFGWDVAESTATVSSMMKSMGISSDEAFDLIVKGSQMGLDVQGDLLDTFHEYSSDFARLGRTGPEVLAMLNAGLEAGAYNTDVIADGWREYGIRLMEGGDKMTEVFDSMGMDFEKMQGAVAEGNATWGDHADKVVRNLLEIESEVERNAAGVVIFGTKWEDVGGDVFLATAQAKEGVEGVTGASRDAAAEMTEGLGPAVTRLKRTFITEFAPLGDLVGKVITEKVVPFLDTAAEWLGEKIPIAIETLEDLWTRYWPQASRILTDFWTAIKPGLLWIKDVFQRYTTTYLPQMRDAWDILKEGFRTIAELYNTQLKPALQQLWDTLGIGEGKTTDIAGAVGTFQGFLAKLYASGVIELIKGGIRGLTLAFKAAKIGVDLFKMGMIIAKHVFEKIQGVFERVRDRINWMKDAFHGVLGVFNEVRHWISVLVEKFEHFKSTLAGFSLPSWLTPGSPTPLETGLLGIGKALAGVQKLSGGGLALGGMTMAGAGAGGGGTVVNIVNYFGPGSVRDDQDILEIADAITQNLELRGIGPIL